MLLGWNHILGDDQQRDDQITSAQSVHNILLENSALKGITLIYTTAELKSYFLLNTLLVGVQVSTRKAIRHGAAEAGFTAIRRVFGDILVPILGLHLALQIFSSLSLLLTAWLIQRIRRHFALQIFSSALLRRKNWMNSDYCYQSMLPQQRRMLFSNALKSSQTKETIGFEWLVEPAPYAWYSDRVVSIPSHGYYVLHHRT